MLCTSTESTFDPARPFVLKPESSALSVSLTLSHIPCFPDTTELYPKRVSGWTLGQIRGGGQRSGGHQLAFTKYKDLISGLPKKGFFICRCFSLLYSVTITPPFSLSLLGSSKLDINSEMAFRKWVSVKLFSGHLGTKYLR